MSFIVLKLLVFKYLFSCINALTININHLKYHCLINIYGQLNIKKKVYIILQITIKNGIILLIRVMIKL